MKDLINKIDAKVLLTALVTTVLVWLATTLFKPFEPQVMSLINSAYTGVNDEYLMTSRAMGRVHIGMKADDLYRWATERNYDPKSYNSSALGCYGSSVQIYNGKDKLAYVELDSKNCIESILVYSDMFRTATGINCGMRLGDVSRMYNDLELFQGGPYDEEYMVLEDLEMILYYKNIGFANSMSAGSGWRVYDLDNSGANYATKVDENREVICIRICGIPCRVGNTHLDYMDMEEGGIDDSTEL